MLAAKIWHFSIGNFYYFGHGKCFFNTAFKAVSIANNVQVTKLYLLLVSKTWSKIKLYLAMPMLYLS